MKDQFISNFLSVKNKTLSMQIVIYKNQTSIIFEVQIVIITVTSQLTI